MKMIGRVIFLLFKICLILINSTLLFNFLERKTASAVLHCNGKLPSLASLIYSGSEFKMKNQGIIKVCQTLIFILLFARLLTFELSVNR